MPETFEEFSREYLTERGVFSEHGKEKYMNDIAGLLSYLNREFDVRQFAQPIIENVVTEMKTFDNQIEINKKIEYDSLKEIHKLKNKRIYL